MYVLGVDYGEKRVGLAVASRIAKLPTPLVTLINDETLIDQIKIVLVRQDVSNIVVGLPRNMDGSFGAQADVCRQFANRLLSEVDLPVVLVDETLSSVEAAERMQGNNKSVAGLDAAAAACILERYFEEHQQ